MTQQLVSYITELFTQCCRQGELTVIENTLDDLKQSGDVRSYDLLGNDIHVLGTAHAVVVLSEQLDVAGLGASRIPQDFEMIGCDDGLQLRPQLRKFAKSGIIPLEQTTPPQFSESGRTPLFLLLGELTFVDTRPPT